MDSAAPAAFVIAFSHVCDAGSNCLKHSHQGVEIVFHPSGSGVSRCADGSLIDFNPGDTIVYPPGVMHDQPMRDAGADNCIQIKIVEPSFFPAFTRQFKLPFIRSQAAFSELGELAAWNDSSPQAAKNLRASALLLTLLDEASSISPELPAPGFHAASRARDMAVSELRKPPCVAEIANAVGLSADHLRHLVAKHFGKGLKEMSLEARMRRAMNLLANSPMTLKDIADECGFANPRAFCAAFKSRTGSSPGSYRMKTLQSRKETTIAFGGKASNLFSSARRREN